MCKGIAVFSRTHRTLKRKIQSTSTLLAVFAGTLFTCITFCDDMKK